jgi:hypothetical protein
VAAAAAAQTSPALVAARAPQCPAPGVAVVSAAFVVPAIVEFVATPVGMVVPVTVPVAVLVVAA